MEHRRARYIRAALFRCRWVSSMDSGDWNTHVVNTRASKLIIFSIIKRLQLYCAGRFLRDGNYFADCPISFHKLYHTSLSLPFRTIASNIHSSHYSCCFDSRQFAVFNTYRLKFPEYNPRRIDRFFYPLFSIMHQYCEFLHKFHTGGTLSN